MGNPLYQVGEEVWVEPHSNGTGFATKVAELHSPIGIMPCSLGHNTGYGYRVDPDLYPSNNSSDFWCEQCLRKHPPFDEAFESFKSKLGLTQPEVVT